MDQPDPAAPAARQFALAWLMHPVSVVALAVMVLNDHVLKAQVGSWWTGKLSDVAGLVFFPALVALAASLMAPRARVSRLTITAAVVTGVGFTAVKASEAGAAFASSVLSALAGPSRMLADATDLAALAALAVAVLVARTCARVSRDFASTWRRALATVVVPGAILASVATTQAMPSDDVAVGLEFSDRGELIVALGETWDCTEWKLERSDCLKRYAQDSDGWWTRTEKPEFVSAGVAANKPTPVQAPTCRADAPQECFRPMPGGFGVQQTTDGGATWTTVWSLTPEQRDYLGQKAPKEPFYEEQMADYAVTRAVAVREVPGGYEVWAANGIDGLTMRDSAGTWHRLGWTTLGSPQYAPTEPHPLSALEGGGYSNGATLGLTWLGPLASAAAWVVVHSGRRRVSAKGNLVLGVVLGGAVAAVGIALAIAYFGRETGQEFPRLTPYVLLAWALVVSACIRGCARIAGSMDSRSRGDANGIYAVVFAAAGMGSGLALAFSSGIAAQILMTVVPVVAITVPWQRSVRRRLELEDKRARNMPPAVTALPQPPPASVPQPPST